MVVEFTVGNFLSFNEKRTISFEARGGVSELKENIGKNKLLCSLVIYGANSSGKSNLLKALGLMKNLVFHSIKLNFSDKLDYLPFLLSIENIKQPTFFEIVFLYEGKRLRYGFEYNLTTIVNEWLFVGKTPKTEKPLFIRTIEGIGVSDSFKEGKGLEEKTNDNRLFLSKVADENGRIAKQVMDCFFYYNVLSGIEHDEYGGFSLKMFEVQSKNSKESLEFFKKLQLGFQDIEIIENDKPNNLPKDMPTTLKTKIIKDLSNSKIMSLNTIHNIYDKKEKVIANISWKQDDYESEGTKKIMDLSGPIFESLSKGKTLIVDELDAKLHPLITMHIVSLFNNPNTNSKNAQLLFATHDTNLLSTDVFRRDQIWFAEKDSVEQTDLYSLDDFVFPDGTKVRKDANLEKNYIRGRYGAIPFITNF